MKRGLVIADLHTGSQFGIMPEVGVVENIVTGDNEEILPNKGQQYLLERWNKMLDTVGRVDFCVINGDCCDGPQKKSDAMYLRTTSLDAQVEWASSLISQIKTNTYYVTLGSRYHTQEQQPLDKMVAKRIGAKKFGTDILQTLKDEDIRIHYSHYVGGTRSVWMYACYSDNTEVLTENGWKLHKDVLSGERIAVFNPSTRKLYFDQPLDLHIYDYNGSLISIGNQLGEYALVTPNHKVWIRKYTNADWETDFAENLMERNRTDVLLSAPFDDGSLLSQITIPEATYQYPGHLPKSLPLSTFSTDDWCEFIGYYLSEGGRQKHVVRRGEDGSRTYQLTISQKDKVKAKIILDCINRLKLPHQEYFDSRSGVQQWHFGNKQLWEALAPFGSRSDEKQIPREFFSYPLSSQKKLFDAMMLGDGSYAGNIAQFYTTSFKLANDFQELATRLGYPARTAFHYAPHKPHHKTGFRVYIRKGIVTTITADPVSYNGKVYCFKTNTGYYLTRLPEQYPTIQGNTTPIAKDMVLIKLNDDVKRYGKVKLCVRSHRHWLVGSFYSRQMGIVTPGWQLITPQWKRFGGITPPDIGWVVIEVDDDGKVNLDWSAEYVQPVCVMTSD